jgi:DNA polymerase III psi subunit
MTEKQVIKIRDVDKDIATRLVTVAKKDYASRDEMLRDVLKKIAYEEFQLESELRYQAFTKDVVESMQLGMDLMVREFFRPASKLTEREKENG